MGCRAADNIFDFLLLFAAYCGGGGGDGGETCQLVTAPGPERSSKLGIKCRDGQKIGWEFKEALSQRGGTADRLHAGPLPLPPAPITPPPPSSQVHGDGSPRTVHGLLQSDWPLVKACHWGGEDGRTSAGRLWLGGRGRRQVLAGVG